MTDRDTIRAKAIELVTLASEAGIHIEVSIDPVDEPDPTVESVQPFTVIAGGLE